jgi:hypothetical protein
MGKRKQKLFFSHWRLFFADRKTAAKRGVLHFVSDDFLIGIDVAKGA